MFPLSQVIGAENVGEAWRHIDLAPAQANRFQEPAKISGSSDVQVQVALAGFTRLREFGFKPFKFNRHHACAPDDRTFGR
jgi:hypothetical protein